MMYGYKWKEGMVCTQNKFESFLTAYFPTGLWEHWYSNFYPPGRTLEIVSVETLISIRIHLKILTLALLLS